jgi:streptogramin lyase
MRAKFTGVKQNPYIRKRWIFMKYSTRKILAIRVALAVAVASTLLAVGSIIVAPLQSTLASGISNVTDYFVPGSDPWGTAFDSSGRVWVALPGCDPAPSCSSSTPPGKLALFDPNAHNWATVVSLPAGYGQPVFVAVDQSGKVWFTMPVTNTIGLYDPVSTTVTQWAVPTPAAGPWDLVIDSNGKVWFTEHYVNKIGSFDPSSQTFHEIATPASNSDPYGITVDTSNNIWFTENTDSVALIGEYTNQGVLNEYKIRNTATGGTGLTPHLITIDPNGNIWWSQGWVHAIATLNLAAAQPGTNNGVTEYQYTPSCSTCGSHTSGISADKQGLIWLDDSLQNTFGSFPVGGGSFSFYNSPGSHPHDGLNVDSQNRIWFDEEFSNKLAEAIQGSASPTPTPTATTTPLSVTPLATDTFQRANQSHWGTASDGQTWGGDANNQKAFSISGNAGLVSNTGSSSHSAVLGPKASDAEVYATGSISSFSNSNFGDVLRWTDGNNWYKAFIDGFSLLIQKKVAGTTTTLASVPFAATTGTSYTIHFRVVGSTLTANAWAASGSEPGGWMATASDSALTSGYCGMRFLTQSGTATVTSFLANALGGSGSPTPTATPTATPTSTPTPTPTPTPGATLGTDTFQRANQSHWGTASDGQTWGGDANSQSVFSISGNAGLVSNTGSSSYSAVLGPTASDAEVYATGSISSFSNSNFGDVLRWTDGNNWYKAFIDGFSLIIQKKVAGTTTTLASVPFAATTGTSYTIHFRVVGSTLTANAWAASGSEPGGWMATASDSTFPSGYCGMRFLTQSGTATVTSFLAKSL